MKTSEKRILWIAIPLLVALIVLYVLVNAVYVEAPAEVVYPSGNLTDSIFEQQNNVYESNSSLPQTYEFKQSPYRVDVPAGEGATVGLGTIFKVTDDIFVYVTEYKDGDLIHDVMASQFPAALLINYVADNTRVTIQQNRTGFINGFTAEYLADLIYVSDGISSAQAVVLGYGLVIPDETYAGNHILIATGTTTINTDSLKACDAVLSAIMKTVRKDDGLDKAMQEENASYLVETQVAGETVETAVESEEELFSEDMPAADTSLENNPETGNITTVPLVLDRAYADFQLDVSWDKSNPVAVLELFTPDGETYYEPSAQGEYSARFNVPTLEAGNYELHIMNYEACGAIATTMAGN